MLLVREFFTGHSIDLHYILLLGFICLAVIDRYDAVDEPVPSQFVWNQAWNQSKTIAYALSESRN